MKADRETNRLPLRAGAMLLLAIAVVCIGLGWHSAATSGDDGKADLADTQTSASADQTPSASTPKKASTSTAPSTVTDAADVGTMCVLNAGTQTGLAGEVSDALKAAGFTVSEAANLSTASISENTIFYGAGKESAAKKVAESVPGGADVTERPAAFTKCPGELAVVVVSK
ncbi:LytR C-terminal domain-containing protein [Gordonia malaquae]|nr:LytR C-terminal domain-containing protein [Gordonia malaquae]